MKKSVVALLSVLCALMILALPMLVPSGAMLDSAKESYMNEEEDLGDLFGRLLFPSALAEEETAAAKLPIDFTPGMATNSANVTEAGYSDDSIIVEMETLYMDNSPYPYIVCRVKIADASQLRTATAGSLTSTKTALPTSMAAKNNAVLAFNADNFADDATKKSFEYRMGQKIRAKSNSKKDMLIIDENGDFHLLVKASDTVLKEFSKQFNADGHTIVNAFTFGPALVKDGELLTMDKNYSYAPNAKNPRMAIGQIDELSYVVVLAQADAARSGKYGMTHQELANLMYDLGCKQAYNFDGGNSAILILNGVAYHGQENSSERALSDIVYFATTVQGE